MRCLFCLVLSTLLYGAESWTVYMGQAHGLNAYMMRHLRQILGVKWWHRIPNQDILMKTNMSSMYETLIHVHRNLRWAGHLIRLDNTQLPKQIIYSQLKKGHRSVGRPKLRFKDTIKRNLARKGIPPGSWDKKSKRQTTLERTCTKEVVIGYDGQQVVVVQYTVNELLISCCLLENAHIQPLS